MLGLRLEGVPYDEKQALVLPSSKAYTLETKGVTLILNSELEV
jgi:hypothetical protein